MNIFSKDLKKITLNQETLNQDIMFNKIDEYNQNIKNEMIEITTILRNIECLVRLIFDKFNIEESKGCHVNFAINHIFKILGLRDKSIDEIKNSLFGLDFISLLSNCLALKDKFDLILNFNYSEKQKDEIIKYHFYYKKLSDTFKSQYTTKDQSKIFVDKKIHYFVVALSFHRRIDFLNFSNNDEYFINYISTILYVNKNLEIITKYFCSEKEFEVKFA